MRRLKNHVIVTLVLALLASCFIAGCAGKSAGGQVDQKLDLAIKYLSEQKFDQAILAYQEAIKIDPKNAAAYKGLGLAYVLAGKTEEAEKALQNGLAGTAQGAELQLAMAGFYMDTGKFDQAVGIYQQLIKAGNPAAYQAYSMMLTKQDKTAEAVSLLKEGWEANRDSRLGQSLANLYKSQGDRNSARVVLMKALELQPEQSGTYQQLAELYMGEWDELLALGAQMLQQGNTAAGTLIQFTALSEKGRYQEVVSAYQAAGEQVRKSSLAALLAARAYTALGQKEQALATVKSADLSALKTADMMAALAGFYLESGDKEMARQVAARGLAADPSLLENYLVLYHSYQGEDDIMAGTWAIHYLLASGLGYSTGLQKLSLAGITLMPSNQAAEEPGNTSKTIALAIIMDASDAEAELQRSGRKPSGMHGGAYYDAVRNIAYTGECEEEDNWRPVIIRHHSPSFIPYAALPADAVGRASYAGKIDKFLNIGSPTWFPPVRYEGTVPLEDHIRNAGYPMETITFQDK